MFWKQLIPWPVRINFQINILYLHRFKYYLLIRIFTYQFLYAENIFLFKQRGVLGYAIFIIIDFLLSRQRSRSHAKPLVNCHHAACPKRCNKTVRENNTCFAKLHHILKFLLHPLAATHHRIFPGAQCTVKPLIPDRLCRSAVGRRYRYPYFAQVFFLPAAVNVCGNGILRYFHRRTPEVFDGVPDLRPTSVSLALHY